MAASAGTFMEHVAMKTTIVRTFCNPPQQMLRWWTCLRLVTLLVTVSALLPVMPVRAERPTIGTIVATPNTPISFDSAQGPPNTRPLPIKLESSYTDPDAGQTHSLQIIWDDGTVCNASGVVPEPATGDYCSIDNATKTIVGRHTYSAPGVYAPLLIVITNETGEQRPKQYRFVVIYDDTSGHIKGAAGYDFDHQYHPQKWADGPAQFGFTFGYNADGTYRRNSRFRFDLFDSTFASVFSFSADFSAASQSWMVISGANAILGGRGTIAGSSTTYNFVVSMIDGARQTPPGPDRLRIRITPTTGGLYYDTELTAQTDIMITDPTTVVGGELAIVTTSSTSSFTSATGEEVIVIGDAPQEAIDNIGLSEALFMPFIED